MEPSTVVLLRVAPADLGVKTLYEVFSWGQEAHGEYLYYGEIDSAAVKPDGTGDLTKASVYAEVSVSFESDTLSAVIGDLRTYVKVAEKQRGFSFGAWLNQEGRQSMSPAETCLHLRHVPELLIDVSQRSWRRLMINAPLSTVVFSAAMINESRVTEIVVGGQRQGASLRWLWDKFNGLCDTYNNIPAVRFHGARRE